MTPYSQDHREEADRDEFSIEKKRTEKFLRPP